MRLSDADGLTEGRVENDPVVIAAKCTPTAYDPDKIVVQLEELKKAEQDRSDDCDENGFGDGDRYLMMGEVREDLKHLEKQSRS